jgi:hypothetical protein
MAKKMPARLVALSASAVAIIYLGGLVSTQPASDNVAVAAAGSAVATSTTSGAAPSTVATAAAVAGSASYADGTYSGSGTSP